MDPIQTTARDYWLSGISFENNFKPFSDQATCDYMKSIGHKISKSGIFKWRKRFDWEKDLDFRIKQLTSENKKTRASLGKDLKEEAVQKTIVDLSRNKALLGAGYEILEAKCKLIMQNYRITKKITEADTKLAIAITTLVANREDRMLDRNVFTEALGRDDALRAIAAVAGEISFDGEGEFDDTSFESGEIIDVKPDTDDFDEDFDNE